MTAAADERAIAGVIDRPRLTARLESPFWQLCVLQAPSGAGKTTLLRSWAIGRGEREPLAWLTVTSAPSSVATFWTWMCESAARAGLLEPRLSRSLVRRVSLSEDPTASAIAFLADVGPVTLVIDAYEQLGSQTPQIDRALLRAVDELPRLRVIVAGRGGTSLADVARRLRNQTHVISDGDLAFDEGEIGELLRRQTWPAPAEMARRVHAATRGYALAVAAAVLTFAQSGVLVDGAGGWEALVATDFRSQLPDPVFARFVASTSVPPYFDAELATALTGHQDASQMLAVLERLGFGRWIPFVRARPVFQYAEAVRESFLHGFRTEDPHGYRHAARAASVWCSEHGLYEKAMSLAIAAHDYRAAVRAFVNVLGNYPESYSSDRLLATLETLPVRAQRSHPMLAFALGLARSANPARRAIAADAFRYATTLRVEARILGGEADRFIALSVRAISLRMVGRFVDSGRTAERAVAELDEWPAADRSGALTAMLLRQLGYCLLQAGQFDSSIATLTRAVAIPTARATHDNALAHLAGAHAVVGDLPRSRLAREQIADTGSRGPDQPDVNAMALVADALARLDAREPGAALEVIAPVAMGGVQSELWPFAAAVQLHAQLMLAGGLAQARAVEEQLRAAPPGYGQGDGSAMRTVLGLQAISWLTAGRVSKAERILAGQRRHTPELLPARLVHALLADRQGRTVDALGGWLRMPGHTVRTRLATLVLGAATARRTGNDNLALSLLQQMADLQDGYGVKTHLDLVPDSDRADLIALATDRDVEALAVELRAGVDAVPASSPVLSLTARERVVLAAMATTTSRETIAERLTVSVNTVKTQMRSIYRKLGVASRDEALNVALEHELLDQMDFTSS